jgi:hypothetical protein
VVRKAGDDQHQKETDQANCVSRLHGMKPVAHHPTSRDPVRPTDRATGMPVDHWS